MMGVKHLRRFDDQGHIPQTFANHCFPKSGSREKRGQSCVLRIDLSIREEEESRAPAAAQRGSGKLSKTAARPRDSSCGRKAEIDFLHGAKERAELRQLTRGDDGTWQRDSVFQVDIQRHHVGFTQRIDRRVGDLRESLFAVIPQCSRKRRKKRGRRVVTHAPVRFLALN